MKNAIKPIRLINAATVFLLMAVGLVHAIDAKKSAAKPAAAPVAAEPPPPPPKSIFEDAKPGYTDPFFPRSLRFGGGGRTQAAAGTTTNVVSVPIEQLMVRSIIIGKEKTAQINDKILTEGDVAVVKVGKTGVVQVRLVEIRPRSVLIKIDPSPETREIFLRASP